MVLLIRWRRKGSLRVVEEVMRLVIQDVAEDTAAEYRHCDIPIPIEYEKGEAIEGCGEDDEEGRGHD